jgi:hypothetical protein
LDAEREAWKGEAYAQGRGANCYFYSGHAEFFKYCDIFGWTFGSEPIMDIENIGLGLLFGKTH